MRYEETRELDEEKFRLLTGVKNVELPHRKTKKKPLTKDQKEENKELASQRVVVENVIGLLKRFKIISDKYRNRRKRFGLRFNLIAGIYNLELML